MTMTQPVRDEHRQLLPRVEALRTAAQAVDGEPDRLAAALDHVLDFLTGHLIPHARAEDTVLYPAVERAMHAPGATATMRRDHVEVVGLTHELGELRLGLVGKPTAAQREALLRVLYGLYGIVRLHFAKEEEIYLPVLDEGLAPDEADAVVRAMPGHDHPDTR